MPYLAKTVSLVAIISLVLLDCGSLRADEITKKDGKVVYGIVVKETTRQIFVLRMDGKTERIDSAKIESVVESNDTGDEEIDAKIKAGESLASVAEWAKSQSKAGYEVVARMAVRADDNDAAARLLLGHQNVGGTWFEDSKAAAKARNDLVASEMKARGMVPHKGGWISTENRPLISKSPDNFVLDDENVWRDKETVMTERGFFKLGDKWVKAGTQEDKDDIENFKKLLGEDIFVLTTKHFRLYIQQYPADQISEFAELVEKVYDWFLKEMDLPPDHDVFRGNKGHMWIFREKNVAMEWYNNYRNRFSLSDDFGKLLSQGGGNVLSSGNLLNVAVPDQSTDVRHNLVNHAAHFLLRWFSNSANEPRSWLFESFGVHAEAEFLGSGHVVHSTLAKYGNDGGKADKGFTTKDAESRSKGSVREGSDEDLITLNKIDLNSLSGDHIAKGYTIVRWLIKEHREAFIKWLRAMNVQGAMDSIPGAFGEEWTHEFIDKKWRELVKKKF